MIDIPPTIFPGGVDPDTQISDGVTFQDLINLIPIQSLSDPKTLGKTNSIMLTGFSEFDYDTTVQPTASGDTFNAIYDTRVSGLNVSAAQADFIYTVSQDLAKLPGINLPMFWVQWFSSCPTADGTDPLAVAPAINSATATDLTDITQWSAGGYNKSTAGSLGGTTGGSPNDASLIRGMQYLQERGYEIGFAPMVLGEYSTSAGSTPELVWRGDFSFSTTQKCQTWMNSYVTFVQWYIDLFSANGINLARTTVGSEFENFTVTAPAAQWAIISAALQSLAAYVKTKFPKCVVTYAANYTDYGVGGNFRCDSLWSCPNIDEVGIDWYFPIATQGTTDLQVLTAGIRNGEDIDYTYTLTDDTQRAASTSSGKGKTGIAKNNISTAAGIKNVLGFYKGYHYLTPVSGNQAEATPLPGYDRDHNPYGMGYMMGTARPAITPNIASAGQSGVQPVIPENATYLVTNGTTSYGMMYTPTFPASSSTTSYTLTAYFRLTAIPSANYARLLRLSGIFEVMIDTSANVIKLGVGGAGTYFNLGGVDTDEHQLSFTVDISKSTLSITWDGTTTTSTLSAGDIAAIPSGLACFVGGYNWNNNLCAAEFYTLGLLCVQSDATYGGTFHFDEAYSGVRTNWIPESKKISITEVGFASISGTSVEPNNFVYCTYGTPPMANPPLLDALTTALWNSLKSNGWSPAEVYGPYGSNFRYDPIEQKNALYVTTMFFDALRESGIVSTVTVYNLDARPFSALTALSSTSGSFYYVDAPMCLFNHSLAGKPAGNNLDFYKTLLNTQKFT